MDFYGALLARRTVRDFEDKPIPPDALERIVNAGLRAPSNNHMREWEFIVLNDKAERLKAIQMVRDNRERLIGLFHGNIEDAWSRAVALCRRANTVLLDRLADITVVSVGGRPKDSSLYQSHRAIRAGVQATRPGVA